VVTGTRGRLRLVRLRLLRIWISGLRLLRIWISGLRLLRIWISGLLRIARITRWRPLLTAWIPTTVRGIR
jgi:hypothetical protein